MGQRRTGIVNFAPSPPEDGDAFQPFELIEQNGLRTWYEVKLVTELKVDTAGPPAEDHSTAAVAARGGPRNREPRGSASASGREATMPPPPTESVPVSQGVNHHPGAGSEQEP